MVLELDKTDIDCKERSLYYLLKDRADLFEQSLQGQALRAIMDRILSEIWTDNQRLRCMATSKSSE